MRNDSSPDIHTLKKLVPKNLRILDLQVSRANLLVQVSYASFVNVCQGYKVGIEIRRC